MSNLIDNHVPDFLLSPRFKFVRHFLLLLTLVCITISIFANQSGELVLTWERFYGWVFYFLLTSVIIYFNLYVLAPRFLIKGRLLKYLASMLVLTSFSLVFIAILQMNVQEVSANYEDGNPYIILNMITSIISFGLLIFGTSALLLFKYWIGYSQRIDELASSTLQSELKFLKKQINPHFLYNGFYNIYRMAKKDSNDDIAEFSQLLSEYYQYITRNAADTVTMEQEIRHAMTYLKIQQIRFSNRLSVEIGPTPSEFGFLMVPRLILQPILENAFEHGMKNVLEPKLFIRFEARLGEWNVCIEDNGTEFSPEELSELQQKLDSTDTQMETTALINIHRRLRYHFGPESGLRLSRTPAGSLQVQLHIVKEE